MALVDLATSGYILFAVIYFYYSNILENNAYFVLMQGRVSIQIVFVEAGSVCPKAKESPSTAVHPLLGDLYLCEFQDRRKS